MCPFNAACGCLKVRASAAGGGDAARAGWGEAALTHSNRSITGPGELLLQLRDMPHPLLLRVP